MLYFSYGSNMSMRRILARVASVKFVAVARLSCHKLKFHKLGKDGSGKCDAVETGDLVHTLVGVVFEITVSEKKKLDKIEGLGNGYEEKIVQVRTSQDCILAATTYYATRIDPSLRPFHWYKNHVVQGAIENGLSENYIQTITAIDSIDDPNPKRYAKEIAIYR